MSDTPTHFGRLGEQRVYRFADATCISAACWMPLVLIEKRVSEGDKEHCGCRAKMTGECPARFQRVHSEQLEKQRRRAQWVDRG